MLVGCIEEEKANDLAVLLLNITTTNSVASVQPISTVVAYSGSTSLSSL